MALQDTLAFLLNPQTLKKAKDIQKQVTSTTQIIKKIKEQKPLTEPEKKVAQQIATTQTVLKNAGAPVLKQATGNEAAQTQINLAKQQEELTKKKYAGADILSSVVSKALPKIAAPLVQQAGRGIIDQFTTPKGYKQEEVAALIAGKDKNLNFQQKMDAIRDPNTYLLNVPGKEKQAAIDKILGVKQKQYEDYIKPPTQEELRQNFVERGLAPLNQTSTDSLKGVLAGTVGGVASGMTLGISDIVGNATGLNQAMQEPPRAWKQEQLAREQKQMEPTYKAFTQIAPQAATILGSFIGGAGTYSAIASRIGSKLQAIKGPIGQTLARHPVLTTYLVQNPLEEVVEGVVRKSTGQQYGVNEFLWGLGMGTVFSSLGLGRVKQDAVSRNVETVLKNAEIKKGSVLTPQEFQDTILNAKLLGNQTGKDLMTKAGYMFGENRLVYKTGKGAMPSKTLPDRYEDSPSAGEFGKYQVLAPEVKFENKDGMKLIRDKATAEVLGVRNRAGVTKMFDTGKVNTEAVGKELMKQRLIEKKMAEKSKGEGLFAKAKKIVTNIETGLFDKAAVVDRALKLAVKEGRISDVKAGKFDEAYARHLRSGAMTDQLLQDVGFKQAARNVKDLEEGSQYGIAKHRLDVAEHKKLSESEYREMLGGSKEEDRAIVNAYSKDYEATHQEYVKMNNQLMDKYPDLFKADEIAKLRKMYPNYVPLIREGKEDLKILDKEDLNFPDGSLSRQTVLKDLEGSALPPKNIYESMINRAIKITREGEKNEVAKALASFANEKGFENDIWKLNPGQKAEYTMTYLKNGEPQKYGISKEFHDFTKGTTPSKIGFLFDASRALMKVFKGGTTGWNLPFLTRNPVKDYQTAKINSKYGINLYNEVIGFGSAVKDAASKGLETLGLEKLIPLKKSKLGIEYDKFGGGGTSLDLFKRNKAKTLSQTIGVGKAGGPKILKPIKYAGRTIKNLYKGLEGTINISERMTRLATFRKNLKGFEKAGYKPEDAKSLAFQESAFATADFIRGGRFKSYITGMYPYQSAGFAGARSLQKAFKRSPAKTAMRIAKYVILPEAATVAWNLADPERRKIYADIPDYEKNGSYIIIAPWAKFNESENRYEGIYKLPKMPGISSMTIPFRKVVEQQFGTDDGAFASDWINALSEPFTGLSAKEGFEQTVANYTPYLMQVPLESAMNKNMFKNQEIIPFWLKDKPASEQKTKYTPEEYVWLGEQLGVSPLTVQHYVQRLVGAAGEQAIGVRDPIKDTIKGFYGTTGGEIARREKQAKLDSDKVLSPTTKIVTGTKTFNRTRTF
jgi:hypothetical protein